MITSIRTRQPLDAFGYLLIGLVARLTRPAYVPNAAGPIRRLLARRTVDGIIAMGRLVDRVAGYPFTLSTLGAIATNRAAVTQTRLS